FAGVVSGTGTLSKFGAGTLTFNSINPFSGNTQVHSGKLIVGDDSHADASLGGAVIVAVGASLGGIGRIGGLDLFGTVAPGNSLGTLHVTGNATFQTGSSYQIEAKPDGQSDAIVVGGSVSILGGSALVLAQTGNWAPQTNYTVLTGAGGITGRFDTTSSNLTFLTPVLSYSTNAVNLSLQRNNVSFASVAHTSSQVAVAVAAEELGIDNPVYGALTMLDAGAAPQAFEQLAGQIHASTTTALIDDSRYVREAINMHLLSLDNGSTEGTTSGGFSAWSHVWGHGGNYRNDGNAPTVKSNGEGVLIGADVPLGTDGHLGAVIGYGESTIKADAVDSRARVSSDHIGLYASGSVGSFVLRAGAAYAWQKVSTNRNVDFGNYNDQLASRHHASTSHAYLEGGYPIALSASQQLEPFINVARVRVQDDALDEGSAAAALTVAGSSAMVNSATLGLRHTLALDAAGSVNTHASLGWQQNWGDLTPERSSRFSSAESTFVITGVPVDRYAVITQLGVDFRLGKNITLDASYVGQFGDNTRDQGVRLDLSVTF
ncbi:MAG: autotransporter domain-containing protein, partial [Lysobacter sp.]